jgi:hypothetical protein
MRLSRSPARSSASARRLHSSVACVTGTADPAHVARAVAIEFTGAAKLGAAGAARLVVAGKRAALLKEELLQSLPLAPSLRAVWPGLIADLADSTTKSVRLVTTLSHPTSTPPTLEATPKSLKPHHVDGCR